MTRCVSNVTFDRASTKSRVDWGVAAAADDDIVVQSFLLRGDVKIGKIECSCATVLNLPSTAGERGRAVENQKPHTLLGPGRFGCRVPKCQSRPSPTCLITVIQPVRFHVMGWQKQVQREDHSESVTTMKIPSSTLSHKFQSNPTLDHQWRLSRQIQTKALPVELPTRVQPVVITSMFSATVWPQRTFHIAQLTSSMAA